MKESDRITEDLKSQISTSRAHYDAWQASLAEETRLHEDHARALAAEKRAAILEEPTHIGDGLTITPVNADLRHQVGLYVNWGPGYIDEEEEEPGEGIYVSSREVIPLRDLLTSFIEARNARK